MKKIFITDLLWLAAGSLLIAACQPGANPGSPALNILAVETFIADIAQNVAGERAVVQSLAPLGIDPHAYQPTPQDVVKIVEGNVLILNGAGLEAWAADTLENADGERVVIEASAGLPRREAREGEEAAASPEELAEAICVGLDGKSMATEIWAAADPASAAEHVGDGELLLLNLNAGAGGFGGFVKFAVSEDGEYVIAANGGALSVAGANGTVMEVEAAIPLICAGLNGGILLDLEPGEYVIGLAGLSGATTPFYAGAAGSHHHHHESDPHFWLDPLNVVAYVENIRDGLIAADPQGKEVYTQNAAAYIAQLNELHAWIEQQVAGIPAERRLIVTNHESFSYFADRYGFKIIGAVIPSFSSEASPSAQQMALLIDRIRATGASAIFLETGSNPRLAEQIAAETGVKVVAELYTHSLTDANGNAPTYLAMMKFNVSAMVAALK